MSSPVEKTGGAAPQLNPVERGILWPVAYASIFGAPVRRSRLWAQLVGVPASEDEIREALSGPALRALVREDDELVWLRSAVGGDQDARSRFLGRERKTRDLLDRHRDILSFLRNLPGVRLSALSGGCAHEAADDGDIDVFMVVEPGAVWRTLLWSMVVAKARGWRRILCMNYVVDARAQALPCRDFYGAFELISLRPIGGEAAYPDLLRANPWVESVFPNFFRSRLDRQNPAKQRRPPSGGQLLEATARMIQRPYLRHRLPRTSGVELSDHVVRLHATDHRSRLSELFRDALQDIGMEAPPWN